MTNNKIFKNALLLIEKANKEDQKILSSGITDAQFYSEKMVESLQLLNPEPLEHVELAARCQHLYRWEIPRNTYPEGIAGYHNWRKHLYVYQSEKTGILLQKAGYSKEYINKCCRLIRKENLGQDDETQLIEDAACITFVKYYLSDFAKKKSREKLIDILKKSVNKMSDKAVGILVRSKLPDNVRELVNELG